MPKLHIEYRETTWHKATIELDEESLREFWESRGGAKDTPLMEIQHDLIWEYFDEYDLIYDAQDVAYEYDNSAPEVEVLRVEV